MVNNFFFFFGKHIGFKVGCPIESCNGKLMTKIEKLSFLISYIELENFFTFLFLFIYLTFTFVRLNLEFFFFGR